MKTIVITSVLVCFSVVFGHAQIAPKDTSRWKKIVPEVKIPKLDTVVRLDKWNQSIQAIDIPTVLQGKNAPSVNMPTVLLSGKNLAPMPGTENLNKWEYRNGFRVQVDSASKNLNFNIKERGKK